jgi:hypothetical protein
MGALMLRMLTMLALACCVLAACATRGPTQTSSYKLYPGPVRPPSDIAIVRLGDAAAAEFDGRPVSAGDWTAVHLAPGTHAIRWVTEFGASVMVAPGGVIHGGSTVQPTLEAGHVYTLKAGRTYGYNFVLYFWIVDETTGQVVAGKPKP